MDAEVTELWTQLSGRLRAFFRERGAGADEADDLLQETFLRIQMHIGSVREDERLQAWVWSIARNVLTDHLRRLPTASDDSIETTALAAEQPVEPRSEGVSGLVASWLTPMILTLPPKDREALELFELQGLSITAIAERTGLSESGVKSRVQRGRERLRKTLTDCCRIEFDRRGGVIDYERQQRDCCD